MFLTLIPKAMKICSAVVLIGLSSFVPASMAQEAMKTVKLDEITSLLSKISVSLDSVVPILSGSAGVADDFSKRPPLLLGLTAQNAVQIEELALARWRFGRCVEGTVNPLP